MATDEAASATDLLSVEQLLSTHYFPRQFILTAADQSNRIESQPIAWEALVQSETATRSHLAVLWDAVRLANDGEPISVQHLCAWQAAIVQEQMSHGFGHVDDRWLGQIRSGNMEVRVGSHLATRAYLVLDKLTDLLNEIELRLSGTAHSFDVIRLIAESHLR
ncbi:MAG: hypothetical protein Q7O66_09290, partial [Dehalococcoidia bacterium]|nr:hypothetical protein [Dehalococcoidia bacterium]